MAEIIVALIGAIAVVAASAVPLLRRARGAVEADGRETRALTVDAMDAVLSRVDAMGERLDSRINDVRDDIDDVRESVIHVREWQAGHDAEHLLITRPRTGGDT